MTYDSILTAIADPTRRGIFEELRTGPKSVAHLAQTRPVSRPAVSQHLKILEAAGLVSATPVGAARHYRAIPGGLAPLRDYLDEMWGDVLTAFAKEVSNQLEEDNARTRDQND